MSEVDPRLLERLQKLLSLADPEANDSQAQIEAALSKIDELLGRYGLTMAQVKSYEADDVIGKGLTYIKYKEDDGTLISGKFNEWLIILVHGIAYGNHCRCLFTPSGGAFYGRKQDVEVCKFLFDSLTYRLILLSREERDRYCQEYKEDHGRTAWKAWGSSHPRPWRRAWLEGAAQGIAKQFRETRIAREPPEDESTKAVVVAHDKAIQTWMDENLGPIKNITSSQFAEAQGYRARARGREVGESLQIRSGINGDAGAIAALDAGA